MQSNLYFDTWFCFKYDEVTLPGEQTFLSTVADILTCPSEKTPTFSSIERVWQR